MKKYALLCVLVVSAPIFAECERECTGKELAADVVKATLRSADEAETKSCSSCGKCSSSCSSCGKCSSCKSEAIDAETKCNCGKPRPKTVKSADTNEDTTKSCSSCGKCCSSCGCKSEATQDAAVESDDESEEVAAE